MESSHRFKGIIDLPLSIPMAPKLGARCVNDAVRAQNLAARTVDESRYAGGASRVTESGSVPTRCPEVRVPVPFATRDVRIPTPHMDYAAVLVAVFADFFCQKGDRNDKHKGFKRLLKEVMTNKNLTHAGVPVTTLTGRWAPPNITALCSAHWYGESCT